MTDTGRETVERVSWRLAHIGHLEAAALLRALLTRAETAERERDEARLEANHMRHSTDADDPNYRFPWEQP